MKQIHKLLVMLLTVAILTGTMAMTAMADSAISSVSIQVGINMGAGDRLSNDFDFTQANTEGNYVVTNSTRFVIEDAVWQSSLNKDMTIGETPKMEVTLYAQSGNYFKGTYRASNVTIKGGTFVSAKRVDDDTLKVTLKVNPIKGTYEAPEDAYWRENSLGKAKWSGVDGADAYDVVLYRGGTQVHKLEAAKTTSYDFYPYMTKAGTYSFKVRAVPSTSTEQKYGKKSEWTESDEIYIAKEDVSDGSGQTSGQPGSSGNTNNTMQVGWIKDGNIWYYRYPDGSYQKDSWLFVNNKWYLFDGQGRMLNGWQLKNNRWFYMNSNGDMVTGWLTLGDKIYYLYELAGNDQGVMCTGWIKHSGIWYFASSDGSLVKGWQQIDGEWRYFNPSNGSMAVDTTIDGFYVDANGIWKKN